MNKPRNKRPETEPTYTLLFDTKLMRPGCILLQAAVGGDMGPAFRLFDSSTWLLAPTPDMKRLTGTRKEWERAAKMSHASKVGFT